MARHRGSFETKEQREAHVRDFLLATIRYSEHETMPVREKWRQNELLFVGKQWYEDQPDRDRETWKSKLFIHEFAPIIREGATAVINEIMSHPDFLSAISDQGQVAEYPDIVIKLMKYYLNNAGFIQSFFEWVLIGGIYGIATTKTTVTNEMVVRPEVLIQKIEAQQGRSAARTGATNIDKVMMPDSLDVIHRGISAAIDSLESGKYSHPRVGSNKRLEMGVEIRTVNPFDFFWHPDAKDINKSPYQMERMYLPFATTEELFDANVIDKGRRDELLGMAGALPYGTYSSSGNYMAQKARQRNEVNAPSSYWPTIELVEYFGPLLGRKGEVLEDNCHFILGNGRLLLKDETNGYWDQKPPYRTATFSRVPFNPCGQGIADNAVASQMLINDLCSLFVDALRRDVDPPMAVSVDSIVDPSQVEKGAEPGEYIKVYNNPQGGSKDIFTPLPRATNTGPEFFQTVEFLKLAGQKGSSVNTMTSNPSSRARISAQEVQSNDQRRMESLNALSLEIDVNGIEPLIDRLKNIVIQFGFTNDNLELLAARGVLTDAEHQVVSQMTTVERFMEATKSFKLEVKGVRAAIARDQAQRRATEWIQQMLQMPPPAQGIIQWRNVIMDVTEFFGFDPKKWVRQVNDTDKAGEENQFLEQNQGVANGEQEDDAAHLPQHYEAVKRVGPVDALVNHIHGHLQRLQMNGQPIPPPPDDVASLLGMPTQSQDMQQQNKAAKSVQNESRSTPVMH